MGGGKPGGRCRCRVGEQILGGGGGGEDEIRFDAREILVEIGFGEGAVSSNGRGVGAIWDSG